MIKSYTEDLCSFLLIQLIYFEVGILKIKEML
jgi:hypothetical protein